MPSLPEELVEIIAKQLDTIDIRSLRATSRLLAAKASRGHFRTAFHRKTIALNAESLDKVIHLLKHDDLSRFLYNLTVPCGKQHDGAEHTLACLLDSLTVTCTSREEHYEDSDFPLLAKFFTLLQSGLDARPLQALSARLTPECGTEIGESGWKVQCLTAGHVAKGIFLAIRDGGLKVECLDMFADQEYCSIPISIIGGCVDTDRAKLTSPDDVSDTFRDLQTVKRLAVSLTHHPDLTLVEDTRIKGQMCALVSLFKSMTHLVSLTLHWYKSLDRTAGRWDSAIEEIWLHCSLFTLTLPSLRHLELIGIPFQPDSLLDFLWRTSITHFAHQGVCLGARRRLSRFMTAHTWRPILEHIASSESTITYFQLDDIVEKDCLYWFKWWMANLDLPNGRKWDPVKYA
ncbi:hypothetical protein B0A48_11132 [Cryoendolithus antarcticus]|uniref:F-box domain-containing protein n=1 Tax=Cryoendolithus antarcticus TaxID=1507870 RepID=A0A1V8SUU9_9PEZI|nr:hypothetical protein B0A48_11132 [Cryoendolithus antarcticus]